MGRDRRERRPGACASASRELGLGRETETVGRGDACAILPRCEGTRRPCAEEMDMETRWASSGRARAAAARAPCQRPCERGGLIHGGRASSGRRLRESAATAPGGGRRTPRRRAAVHGVAGVQQPQPEHHGVERLHAGGQASRPRSDLHGVERASTGRQACSGRSRSSKASNGRARTGREAVGDGEEGARDPARSMETTAVFPNAGVRGFVRIDGSVDVESTQFRIFFSLFSK